MDSEIRREIDKLWAQFGEMWKYLGWADDAIKQQREADKAAANADAMRKEIAKIVSDTFDSSSRYNNAMLVVGFAGYFAIWTLSKEYLTKTESISVAIFGVSALAGFILWEVFLMFVRSASANRLANLVNRQYLPDEFFSKLEEAKLAEARAKGYGTKVWMIVFPLTVGCALAGAFVATKALIANLLSQV